jgi:GT2 family glycosyltransferase
VTEAGRPGVVVIGRNEGERLARCLASLPRDAIRVYVDSGSSDGSPERARRAGCDVIELDAARPFSAARGRNEGFEHLLARHPGLAFVQFVDGDCELAPGWLDAGAAWLAQSPEVGFVCGRLRERRPDASLYHALCDIEWDAPAGDVPACGGIFLARARAFRAAGGFDPGVVAGEEPELCLRLRRAGWRVHRISAEMAVHDADMHHFGQWWSRAVRGGHAYAEGAARHGAAAERFCVRENLSIVWWAAVWPTLGLALAPATQGLSLALFAAYPLQALRIVRRHAGWSRPRSHAWLYAASCVLGKWPQHVGQWRFVLGRLRRRAPRIIEHKRVSQAEPLVDGPGNAPDDPHEQGPERGHVDDVGPALDRGHDAAGHRPRLRDQRRGQRHALGHRRRYGAGPDVGQRDAGLEQPPAQALAEGRDRGLGAPVEVVAAPAAIAGHRRDHGERAGALALEGPGQLEEQRDDGGAVGRELAQRERGVRLARGLVGQGAVGDQHDVESAERPHRGVDHRRVPGRVDGVHLEGVRRGGAADGEIGPEGVELAGVPPHEEQAGALRGPEPRAGGGDRGRRADDQDPLHRVTRCQKRDISAGSRRDSSFAQSG